MQQEAIPFNLNPRSFALTILLLILMVYTIRFVNRHALSRWPLLRRRITLWIKMAKLGESGDEPSEEPAFGTRPAEARQVQREV
jgi:hypothetical protein